VEEVYMEKSMKFVYVAGPITAYNSNGKWDCWKSEKFVRAAEEISLKLILAGVANHCPHTLGRYWNGVEGATTRTWMEADLEVIRRADALMVCSGWENSQGTLEEIAYATELGLPIFHDANELIAWAHA
jgi:nucleoside 2-deoxyribosyltransferase